MPPIPMPINRQKPRGYFQPDPRLAPYVDELNAMVNLPQSASIQVPRPQPQVAPPQKGLIPSALENMLRVQLQTATAAPMALARGADKVARTIAPPVGNFVKGQAQNAAQGIGRGVQAADAGSRMLFGDTLTNMGGNAAMAATGFGGMLPLLVNDSPQAPPTEEPYDYPFLKSMARPPQPTPFDAPAVPQAGVAPAPPPQAPQDLSTLGPFPPQFQGPPAPPPQSAGGTASFSPVLPPQSQPPVQSQPQAIPSRFVKLPDGSYTSRSFVDDGRTETFTPNAAPRQQPQYMGQQFARDLGTSKYTIQEPGAMTPEEAGVIPMPQEQLGGGNVSRETIPMPFDPAAPAATPGQVRIRPLRNNDPGLLREIFVDEYGIESPTYEGAAKSNEAIKAKRIKENERLTTKGREGPLSAEVNAAYRYSILPIQTIEMQARVSQAKLDALLKEGYEIDGPEVSAILQELDELAKAHDMKTSELSGSQPRLGGAAQQTGGTPDGVVSISSDAEWEALAPGTKFKGPDGIERTK